LDNEGLGILEIQPSFKSENNDGILYNGLNLKKISDKKICAWYTKLPHIEKKLNTKNGIIAESDTINFDKNESFFIIEVNIDDTRRFFGNFQSVNEEIINFIVARKVSNGRYKDYLFIENQVFDLHNRFTTIIDNKCIIYNKEIKYLWEYPNEYAIQIDEELFNELMDQFNK
jgi:hypothetical protein